MTPALDTCSVCPRLCRWACPVAEGTGREAAVPANLALVVRGWRAGEFSRDLAASAASLCTDCGACTAACHLHVPLPEALARARASLGLVAVPEPPTPVDGEGAWIALLTDARDWSAALAARTERAVARWRTSDRLGWSGRGHPSWPQHLARLRAAVGDRTVVVVDREAHAALSAAGCSVRWLDEVIDVGEVTRPCGVPGQPCCGGHGPLSSHHAPGGRRLARRYPVGGALADAGCSAHLKGAGRDVVDVVDVLVEGTCAGS